jgi:DNA-binding CsgD family transcriptional regulator
MPVTQAIERLYEAAQNTVPWTEALHGISQALGAVGSAYVIRDKLSNSVAWTAIDGPCAEFTSRYASYYAPLDLYAPMLYASEPGAWRTFSDCVPSAQLARNEWYNDFLLNNDIADVIGTKLIDDPMIDGILGIQRERCSDAAAQQLQQRAEELLPHVMGAARLHLKLERINSTLDLTRAALDHLPTGIIICGGDSRVMDLNQAGEQILRSGDGLVLRDGRLFARRSFDTVSLQEIIAAMSDIATPAALPKHLLIGRQGQSLPYAITIMPASAARFGAEAGSVILLIANGEWQSSSLGNLVELFGLSRAECRLAVALAKGGKIGGIATEFGVEVSTLRTQLRSIFKKVGVERQSDLVRTLSSISALGSPFPRPPQS